VLFVINAGISRKSVRGSSALEDGQSEQMPSVPYVESTRSIIVGCYLRCYVDRS